MNKPLLSLLFLSAILAPAYAGQVTVEAVTYYDSIQTVTAEYDEAAGTYKLEDEGRQIFTYDATKLDTKNFIEFYKYFDESSYASADAAQEAVNNAYVELLTSVRNFTFRETPLSMADTATLLYRVYLTATPDSSWWNTTPGQSQQQLYVKFLDDKYNVIAVSDTLYQETLPRNYAFSHKGASLSPSGGFLEIYNYDNLSADPDPLGQRVKITYAGAARYPWETNAVTGFFQLIEMGNAAISAHYGVAAAYDFYKKYFDRNGYDGKGRPLYLFVNPPNDDYFFNGAPNDASAHPQKGDFGKYAHAFISFSMGDGVKYNPMVELDLTAHEYTHLVIAYNGRGGLNDNGEPGALDESFADIMGYCVKQDVHRETNDYLSSVNTMVGLGNMRNLKDPKLSGDGPNPDTYKGEHWVDTSSEYDRGGTHSNSMVQSKWFYLLCEGGSGTNDLGNAYSVTGIGIEKAREIVYRNMMTYIMPESDFAAARAGSLSAARDLYGSDSQAYRSVMDAWHAVGVGWNSAVEETEAADADDIKVYATAGSIHISCPDERSIAVYALDGSRIYSDTAAETTINVNSAGLYIVVVGGKVVKIEVRN